MAFSWAETAYGRSSQSCAGQIFNMITTYGNDEPVGVADQEERNIVYKDGVEDQI